MDTPLGLDARDQRFIRTARHLSAIQGSALGLAAAMTLLALLRVLGGWGPAQAWPDRLTLVGTAVLEALVFWGLFALARTYGVAWRVIHKLLPDRAAAA